MFGTWSTGGPDSCAIFRSGWKLTDPSPRWMNTMHQRAGNLLFNDGSVQETDDRGLTRAANDLQAYPKSGPNNSCAHVLMPRSPNSE